MSGTYFDAVLDDNANPLFNGTAEQTAEWLVRNPNVSAQVCIGRTMEMKSIDDYLREYDRSQE